MPCDVVSQMLAKNLKHKNAKVNYHSISIKGSGEKTVDLSNLCKVIRTFQYTNFGISCF